MTLALPLFKGILERSSEKTLNPIVFTKFTLKKRVCNYALKYLVLRVYLYLVPIIYQ